eukprot:TRINITY_DN3849_c0_g1_i1.p2 TRINITY_DN3849_c0_g1~~TRINITY_DN3849_c0_g1_i1.p2  ORF type:complete len:102 (-),score=0.40 TRINITY_DN3849_c0_g1_i1:332-637(-)
MKVLIKDLFVRCISLHDFAPTMRSDVAKPQVRNTRSGMEMVPTERKSREGGVGGGESVVAQNQPPASGNNRKPEDQQNTAFVISHNPSTSHGVVPCSAASE